MMDTHVLSMIIEGVVLLSTGVAAWTKLNQEVTILKSRIINLERRESDIQNTLEKLVEGVNELKILLARQGIE